MGPDARNQPRHEGVGVVGEEMKAFCAHGNVWFRCNDCDYSIHTPDNELVGIVAEILLNGQTRNAVTTAARRPPQEILELGEHSKASDPDDLIFTRLERNAAVEAFERAKRFGLEYLDSSGEVRTSQPFERPGAAPRLHLLPIEEGKDEDAS